MEKQAKRVSHPLFLSCLLAGMVMLCLGCGARPASGDSGGLIDGDLPPAGGGSDLAPEPEDILPSGSNQGDRLSRHELEWLLSSNPCTNGEWPVQEDLVPTLANVNGGEQLLLEGQSALFIPSSSDAEFSATFDLEIPNLPLGGLAFRGGVLERVDPFPFTLPFGEEAFDWHDATVGFCNSQTDPQCFTIVRRPGIYRYAPFLGGSKGEMVHCTADENKIPIVVCPVEGICN